MDDLLDWGLRGVVAARLCADGRLHRPLPPDRGEENCLRRAVLCGGGAVGVRSVVERLRPFGVVLDDLVALRRPTKHGAVFEDGRVRVGDVHNSVLE